jgi:hypothetical protein
MAGKKVAPVAGVDRGGALVRALFQAGLQLPEATIAAIKIYDTIRTQANGLGPVSEKTMKTVLRVVMASVVAMAAGCVQYTTPMAPEAEMTTSEKNFQVLWLAAQDVLREYHFVIDRHDRRAGILTTRPLTGQQFFEPWRKDAVTQWDLWDGSIKTLYRSVTIRIQAKDPQAQWYEPVVEVTVSKPNPPKQPVHSTSAAYGMFILPTETGSEEQHSILGYSYRPEDMPQEDQELPEPQQFLMKDEPLAKKLTEKITAAAAKRLAEGRWQE